MSPDDFTISNHSKVLGNEIYINLNLNKKALELRTKKERKNPIEHDYRNLYEYQTILKIPERYQIEYIPENIEVANEFISGSIRYELKGDSLLYFHSLRLNTLLLNLEEQEKVNLLINRLEQGYKEVVVLQKK